MLWPKRFLTGRNVWACENSLVRMVGTYNLDREELRGILIEGRDRPAAVYCGYNPPYYQTFIEQYGFTKFDEDGLAYAVDLNLERPELQHLIQLAKRIRQRKENMIVRGANLKDMDNEIDRIVDLQNRGLAHFANFTPYTLCGYRSHGSTRCWMWLTPSWYSSPKWMGNRLAWFPGRS